MQSPRPSSFQMLSALAVLLCSLFSSAHLALADGDVMHPIELNGYAIIDAEYLPFVAGQTLHYPGDVLRGFYPASATDAAKDCAVKAYRTLVNFFATDCNELRDAVAAGATPRFGLWINDYSRSGHRASYRPGHFWHRGLSANDFTQGLWTWEVTLTPELDCQGPRQAEILNALRSARAVMTNKR